MNLEKTLAKCVRGQAFFYVTLDPERALGLEDVLPNYTIICPYKSQLTDELQRVGVKVVVLEEGINSKKLSEIVKRGTYGILQADFVQDCINKTCRKVNFPNNTPCVHIVVLKNSVLIEALCKKQKWHLLAPKARIAEQFENKISQYKLLGNVAPYPATYISILDQISIDETRPRKHVLQFNRGHSGNSTFFIESQADLEKLAKKFPKREVKISKYIKGKTYTLNCLVVSDGVILTGSISEQITGLKSATNNPNTTCGNDFTSPGKLKKINIKEIQKIAKNIGKVLYKKGYRGLFGIDVIIEKISGTIYFIEVNTHQPASIPFEAKLHRKIGKVPLLGYFVLDSLYGDEKATRRDLPPIILSIAAKQIIYRNKTGKTLSIKYLNKKYKDRGLLSRMKCIKPNEELYRRQRVGRV